MESENLSHSSVENLKSFLKANTPRGDTSYVEDLKKTLTLGKRKGKKKQNERRTKKSKYMTRKEKRSMGLDYLPRKGMRYEDVTPMYEMWRDYMKHQLDLNGSIPKCEEKNWESFSQSIVKSDFHGALISVCRSKCPGLVGVKGICVMETKNTFKLLCEDSVIRTVPKEECVFVFYLDDFQFVIFGKHICRRPAERSNKKCKKFILSDL